jgi:hypothetical protein
LCDGGFWNDIFYALIDYRGNNLAGFSGELRRRAKRFEQELDRTPGLDWP